MNDPAHQAYVTFRWARGNHGRRRFFRANCTCGWRTPHVYRRAAAEAAARAHELAQTALT